MAKLKYDPIWLQELADTLGTWQKVCVEYRISPDVIRRYKQRGLLKPAKKPARFDVASAQQLYDAGLSLRKVSASIGIPTSLLATTLKTRSHSDAMKLVEVSFTENGLKRLSDAAKRNGLGGYRPHPNRGQRYAGVWFDSKWEVRVARSLDKNGIKWIRPMEYS